MYNIKYTKDSYNSVDKFISYLKEYYKRIYFDTWIVDEYKIVSSYIHKTDILFDEIIDTIENTINMWVFWLILETKKEYELSKLVIKVRSYSIVVIVRKTDYVLIDNIFIN